MNNDKNKSKIKTKKEDMFFLHYVKFTHQLSSYIVGEYNWNKLQLHKLHLSPSTLLCHAWLYYLKQDIALLKHSRCWLCFIFSSLVQSCKNTL